jgi:2,4-dienoyl-CoA reductase [(3E)-enoyl-CoA-producing], peroxisomal
MFATDSLKGRTALITGGGSGIGLEIAKTYAEPGASVMLIGRNEERFHCAAKAIALEGDSAAALEQM